MPRHRPLAPQNQKNLHQTGGDIASPSLWDPLMRLTHWTVAVAVIVNGLISEPGKTLHVWIGWIVLAVLAVRLVWGLMGPPEARFTSFPPDPKAATGHLWQVLRGQTPRAHPSHNPAGAIMVYTLWGLLTLVIVTGLIMTGGQTPMQVAAQNATVAAGDWSALAKASSGAETAWMAGLKHWSGQVHGLAANLILILSLVHVAGVIVEGRVMRRNLIKPMLFGSRKE
ncbi:cytochrome b/b6 domain-containing protein (plasmid) [Thioclava litoralis]|uniref:Cytochrome b/b6 domain-containing protein n=1 Tax=Thioclava litoralis TaxID=3076557 RepID=A0ABZ1E4Q9_9RHOB|nr:cytochrome b/b6 domain-containing protein [Thioclava sp. FTW29]